MASRSTFRNPSGDVAWQRQVRDRYVEEGCPPVPHLDVGRAIVRPVSRRCAEQVIIKYEWLGTMAPSRHHYGIFFGDYCAGVCCITVGNTSAGSNVHKMFGVSPLRLGVIARGACTHWAPPGTNSRLVSWTCRLLSRDGVLSLLLAYSDTDAGEIGTIYQACGWTYVGRGGSAKQLVAPNGRIYDRKVVSNTRKRHGDTNAVSWAAQRAAFLAHGWTEQGSNPKHRYVRVLDRSDLDLVRIVESLRMPYPKRLRVGSIDGDAPAIHAGEGGSIPTSALHVPEVA